MTAPTSQAMGAPPLEMGYDELRKVSHKIGDIARKAARVVLEARNEGDQLRQYQKKDSYADLVTATDRRVQSLIEMELKREYPNFKFIGEEDIQPGKEGLTDKPTWIVDPIDGTMNFVHGTRDVGICIGLAINKLPILGVVNFPFLEELYYGWVVRKWVDGQSRIFERAAFRNGSNIKAKRDSRSLETALVAAEIGSDRSEEKRRCVFENLNSVAWKCHGIRSYGSAAMNICTVASGKLDAYYEFGLHSWDMCGPLAVLAGAGGFYCDTTGENGGEQFNLCNRRLIASGTKELAQELSQALVCQIDLPSD